MCAGRGWNCFVGGEDEFSGGDYAGGWCGGDAAGGDFKRSTSCGE